MRLLEFLYRFLWDYEFSVEVGENPLIGYGETARFRASVTE